MGGKIGNRGGGARPGAGRKAGVPNKRTQKAIQVAESTGIMPLDYALAAMRFHFDLVEQERAKGDEADPKVIRAEFAAGEQYARDAMPYLHSRLATVEHVGKDGGPIEYKDARERLAHLIAGAASAGVAGEDTQTTH